MAREKLQPVTYPIEIVKAGTRLCKILPSKWNTYEGAQVIVYSRGKYRAATITNVGPKRVRVAYKTKSGGTVTRPWIFRDDVYVREGDQRAGPYMGTVRDPRQTGPGRNVSQRLEFES